jgi:GT2 family glycosyltransferase
VTAAVGVVVVNWNGGTDTVACLQSLVAVTQRPTRVVVVDNGSTDDSLELVRTWAASTDMRSEELPIGSAHSSPTPWLTILRSPTNLGFSGANNAGIELLRAEREIIDVLLLNNDATLARDYFDEIEKARRSTPSAAILGATIYRFPATEEIWFAGGRAIPLRALISHELTRPSDPAPRPTDFVTGCAMFITGPALEQQGLLPECYSPGYMEDAEYSWRAKRAGVGVFYVPDAVAYHRVGASFRRIPAPAVTYTQNRNRVFFVRRNLRGAQRIGAMGYLAITKPLRALVELVSGRPAQASAVFRGAWDGFVSPRARDG